MELRDQQNKRLNKVHMEKAADTLDKPTSYFESMFEPSRRSNRAYTQHQSRSEQVLDRLVTKEGGGLSYKTFEETCDVDVKRRRRLTFLTDMLFESGTELYRGCAPPSCSTPNHDLDP